MNKILWLLVLLAFPAFADIDQEAGQTAKTAQPNAVKYPPDKVLGASIAIGLNALPKQVAQTTSMQKTVSRPQTLIECLPRGPQLMSQ